MATYLAKTFGGWEIELPNNIQETQMRELSSKDMALASGGAIPVPVLYGAYLVAGFAVGWVVQEYFSNQE